MSSRPAQRRQFAPIAEKYGYRYEGKTRRGHFKWRNADGHLVVTVSDFSNTRSTMNAIRDMRRGQRTTGGANA